MERDFFVEISVFWGFFLGWFGWLVGFYFTWSGACLLYFMSEAVLMQGDNNSLISVGCLIEERWLNCCLEVENMIPVRSEYFKQHMLSSLIQKPGNCYRTKIMLSKKDFEAEKIN